MLNFAVMKKSISISWAAVFAAVCVCAVAAHGAPEPKRDISIVQNYIRKQVGESTLGAIKKREGGSQFLKQFFADRAWMEQFAGSGPFGGNQWKRTDTDAGAALAALDLLVWNDKGGFIETQMGRHIATALALNHGCDWDDEKLVLVMECYREWAADGTLADTAKDLDTRQWREIVTFGQNAELGVDSLRWIHNFANWAPERYPALAWECHYRLENCFGDSVHGPMYYRPWEHRWNTQELRYRVGGVCGGLSKFGSHGAQSHGVRSFTVGQPGHCAYLVWNSKENRWGDAYFVTGHTSPHFTFSDGFLSGGGLAALEEQDRYYSSPKRMGAEYLRWAGKLEESMRYAPGNWQAAFEWKTQLANANAPKGEWDKFAAVLRDTFKEFPSLGWKLYFDYIDALKSQADKIEAIKLGCMAFRESTAKTIEPIYLDQMLLDRLMLKLGAGREEPDGEGGKKVIVTDKKMVWQVLPVMLEGQAKTPTFFRQTINWAAAHLMTDATDSKRFLELVGKAAAKTKSELDFNGMALKASQNEDIAMWRQVFSLMDRMAPGKRGKVTGKKWPTTLGGGELLSKDGLLKTSTTSGYEDPINYRDALEAEGRNSTRGGTAFHTGKEISPWGMVVLPGPADITGITVVNSGGGQNGGRQVPLKVWISEDGEKFTEVFSSSANQEEWNVPMPTPRRAKYVKVGRTPEQRDEFFHLSKILVYGKKLY